MNIIAVIPARYASTRFPGKPLVEIKGKSMIQHVYENVKKSIENVVVATDDNRIYKHVENFGGEVLMTSANHTSGTERCEEAVRKLHENGKLYDVVVNVQGDEPFVKGEEVLKLASVFNNKQVQIATLAKLFDKNEDYNSPNRVKLVMSKAGKALYFSRHPIPFSRNNDTNNIYYKHIGMYAYRTEILYEIVKLPESQLEKSEKLEQLRWLENDYAVYVKITCQESYSIDTPQDLENLKFLI